MTPNKVKATLVMELNVECPHCEDVFDLFKSSANDEGELHRQVINDDRWKIDEDERLETNVCCPECGVKIYVKGIIW